MSCSRHFCLLPLLFLAVHIVLPDILSAEEISLEHVTVTYQGIDSNYAGAIARTVEAAREICSEKLGYEMPTRIEVTINKETNARPRLFNDGVDQFRLTVRSDRDLLNPSRSGVFHLYGMCHEVAHLGMYRPIPQHSWMTTAAAEGWAHYLGSRLVDEVHRNEGADLWPDPYDYRLDGIARLEKQLSSDTLSPTLQGAKLWRELVEIVGDEKLPRMFTEWGKAEIDPTDPAKSLQPTLQTLGDDKRVLVWWNRARDVFFLKRDNSDFVAQSVFITDLTGSSLEMGHDDNKSAGKKSVAGGSHAVRFERPGGDWYLTAVSIHGSRYGTPRPPREKFHIWLCDEDFKVIQDFPISYSKFQRGRAKWVRLAVKPTQVPDKFIICAGFNPSGKKGVFVHYDAEGDGNSLSGLPGRNPRQFKNGDWMIRAWIDQLKSADALGAKN